ncbi:transcription initiation factor IID, 31kD subunit-domain-containing protein [Phellopilus nigrolimitatus]|nr:transcription initiation factor IID, 31kD subunit-domain-containing protein [Phellopilus nigrolimitatus]
MSRSVPTDTLPPTARSIALLLASTPTIQDAQPGVLHQLLEFSHRYTSQVLSDALVYAEHAGRAGKIEMEDVVLAIQARVGWEFGGRVPKEYILSLAAQTNAIPLPSVPEVFGVRTPASPHVLTQVNFDLVPNKPPPRVKQYDEEVEEVEEESDEEDVAQADAMMQDVASAPVPSLRPFSTPSDADMASPGPVVSAAVPGDEGSDIGQDDEDGLFGAGGDDDSDADDAMESVEVPDMPNPNVNGIKRKLVEEDDYD